LIRDRKNWNIFKIAHIAYLSFLTVIIVIDYAQFVIYIYLLKDYMRYGTFLCIFWENYKLDSLFVWTDHRIPLFGQTIVLWTICFQ